MAVAAKTKEEIIDRLLVTKQKSNRLEMTLRFKGQVNEANEVQKKTKKLNKQIDILLGQLIDEWLADSRGVIKDLVQGNANLQRSLAKIKRGVQTAQNLVKALGFIDDAIVIASKFVAAP